VDVQDVRLADDPVELGEPAVEAIDLDVVADRDVTFGRLRMRSITAACCAKVAPLPFFSISAKRMTSSVRSNDGTKRSFMPKANVMKTARAAPPAIAA
jgi:hypothetical protein